MPDPAALIIVENNSPPFDIRVWYEATTLRDAGWKVTVICPDIRKTASDHSKPKKLGDAEDMEGITLFLFPLTFAQDGMFGYLKEYLVAFITIARLSWRVWRQNRFDVIHLCNPPDIFFPIALWYRLLGARVVFDHHDLFPEIVTVRFQGWQGKLFYLLARITEFLTFRCADMVISTNETYRHIARRRGRVREDRTVVVRNGPRLSEFVVTEADPLLKEGFPYMACFVGLMNRQDGVLELIESIHHIASVLNRRDILFVLIGDGSSREPVLAQIKALGLEDIVRMPGFIQDKALLRRYMATADVCLSPEPKNALNVASTFIKIGEYMAMGRPVIAYDLKETHFTLQDAATYVYKDDPRAFAREIVSLLDDPARRQRMGELGRQRVINSLAWEHQQHYLLQAYAQLKDGASTT